MIVFSTNSNARSVEMGGGPRVKSCFELMYLSQALTGSYHNYFRIYDVNGDHDIVLQADKSAFKAKKIGGARGKAPGKKEGLQTEGIDFAKKIVRSARVS